MSRVNDGALKMEMQHWPARPRENKTARHMRRLRFGFAAITIALLAVFLVAASNLARLRRAAHWHGHSYQVLSELHRLQKDYAVLEGAARGWANLGDVSYRALYQEALQDKSILFPNLLDLTSDNPTQQLRLRKLSEVSTLWEKNFTQALFQLGGRRSGAAKNEEIAEIAKIARESHQQGILINGILASLVAEENARLTERTLEQDNSQKLAVWTLLLSTVSIVLLMSVLFVMLDRSTRHMLASNERLEAEVVERAAIHDDLRESRARLAALIENSSDNIWSIDREYHLTSFNRAFSDSIMERFGKPPVPMQDISAYFEDEAIRWREWYERAFEGEHFCVDFDSPRKGRNREQELSFSPIETDGATEPRITGVVVFSRDITERKKIDRLKTEFISTVSHELRTPLTSIRGSLGLLRGGAVGSISPKARPLIDIAVHNAERLVRLINDILDVEKIESGNMDFQLHPLELAPLIRAAMEGANGYASELGVRFEMRNTLAEGARVWADADRLMQVMDNLLSNAAKFSPPGDVVKITLSQHESAFRISVADNGPGVPVEFHERIFSKFAQADASDTRPNGGTGLGLSIARAIVHKLGGTVDFDRTLSRGSVFYFDLPMWHGSSPTVDKQREPTRVLICEDDPNIAELLSLMLQEIGIESDIAHDIKTARDCLRKQSSNVAKTGDKGAMEHSNTYRALMLDLTLPDGDGVSFIRTLRADETTRELPIIVVSATATDRSGQGDLMGDALNVVDWLEKPIDTARLQHAVRSAAGISTPGAGERPRVLHVEDDPDIVRVACEILKGDADIDSASDLSAARTKLARNMYDLVLLDIALPDGDGMELLAQLKNAARPTPVVVFSARELSREDARRTEAALVKSRTSNETLLQTIQSLISKN